MAGALREVTDPAGDEEYTTHVPAPIAADGGCHLARAGAADVLEGDWDLKRVVILECPNMAQLKAWDDSPAYRPLLQIRRRTARSHVVAIEGL